MFGLTDAVSSPPEASSVYIEKFAFLQSTLAALPTPTAIAHAVSQRSSTDSVRVCAADGVGQLSPPRLAELSRLTRAARAGNPAAQLVLVVDRGVVGEGWAPALDEEFVVTYTADISAIYSQDIQPQYPADTEPMWSQFARYPI